MCEPPDTTIDDALRFLAEQPPDAGLIRSFVHWQSTLPVNPVTSPAIPMPFKHWWRRSPKAHQHQRPGEPIEHTLDRLGLTVPGFPKFDHAGTAIVNGRRVLVLEPYATLEMAVDACVGLVSCDVFADGGSLRGMRTHRVLAPRCVCGTDCPQKGAGMICCNVIDPSVGRAAQSDNYQILTGIFRWG